ncbi:hypothetical protein CCO03_09405 [Comamonas serinivorans]|uniref:Uncharacterized protein n=1 Tax=Comamonas serinivorans TaxID=1082851 RepID=A0A1Y0EMH7_9BURK|nr:hypothetical protein CCO03_09405 [Comamonas serinivorans]
MLEAPRGRKLFITDVIPFSQLNEPDANPEGFLIKFVFNEAEVHDQRAMKYELDDFMFEQMCQAEGFGD